MQVFSPQNNTKQQLFFYMKYLICLIILEYGIGHFKNWKRAVEPVWVV